VFVLQWYPVHSVGAASGVEFFRADTVHEMRRDIIVYILQHLYSVNVTNASQYSHHVLAPLS